MTPEEIAEKYPFNFLELNMHNTYPELGKLLAEKIAKSEPYYFFSYELNKKYPEFERLAAETMVERSQIYSLLKFNLHKRHPKLLLSFGE